MPEVTLFSVFLVGLFGGIHCAGMCGGIVSLIGGHAHGAARIVPIRQVRMTPPLTLLLGYNVGRLAAYTLAGALAGGIGSAALLMRALLPVQQIAFILANLLLIGMGLHLTGALRSVAALEIAGRGLWRRLGPLVGRLLAADRPSNAVAAGFVWGWVPCGMVYGVLIAALLSGDALRGAMLLLAFGAGTLPNLLLLGWSAGRARAWLGHRSVRRLAGALIIAFGIAGLARIDPVAHLHGVVDVCLDVFRNR